VEPGTILALTQYWWGWDTPRTRQAMRFGLSGQCTETIFNWLQANRDAQRTPTTHASFYKFATLGRTVQTIQRILRGKLGLPSEYLAGLASLMSLEPRQFVPPVVDWVAHAAIHLTPANRRRPFDPDGIDFVAAQAYARAVLSRRPVVGRAATTAEIEGYLAAHDPAVRRVADAIGAALSECCPDEV